MPSWRESLATRCRDALHRARGAALAALAVRDRASTRFTRHASVNGWGSAASSGPCGSGAACAALRARHRARTPCCFRVQFTVCRRGAEPGERRQSLDDTHGQEDAADPQPLTDECRVDRVERGSRTASTASTATPRRWRRPDHRVASDSRQDGIASPGRETLRPRNTSCEIRRPEAWRPPPPAPRRIAAVSGRHAGPDLHSNPRRCRASTARARE